MSSGHSPIERPLERRNNNCPLRNYVIKTDPSNANEYYYSSASLPWSHRIRTESSQDANCANNSKSLLPYYIIKTSSSQDDKPNNHAESESLPRNQMIQQVLEAGDTYNASSEYVQKDDGLGGNPRGCTASGVIPKDYYVENKSPSDHMGGTNFQSSQDGRYDNDNFEFLPENEEEDSTIQVLPRFRRIITIDSINKKLAKDVPCHIIFRSPSHTRHSQEVIAITQQNRHLLFPTTKKKLGVSKAPQSLLRKVLSRPGASIPLEKFSFLEDEIEFIDIIGETTEEQHHAKIFRITASGRSFALKHKYREGDIYQSHLQFPLPNQRFDRESTTYARIAHLQDLPSSPIPKCYGYIELTKIPQARSRHRRDPFRSTRYTSAAYLDFLIQGEDRRIGSENQQWRRYFRDRPPSACILRGIVLEDIPSCSLAGRNLSHRPKLISSGRESLARLHECGVLHGDVGDLHHALVAKSDGRIV